MTHKQAIKTVLDSAKAHASGHEHCLRIHQAVGVVMGILEVQELQQQTKGKTNERKPKQ